jgi:8-oxo-dGTP diphosphatase
MEIEIFDGNMDKNDINTQTTRVACRGIVEKDGKYLVTRLLKWDITMFPGGGLEEGETLEECTKRELLEETGMIVNVIEKKISIKEYFLDSTWTNHYFTCELVEDTKKNSLTDEEKDLGLITEWKTLDELLENYENNMTKHEHGSNIHNREFLGLVNSL